MANALRSVVSAGSLTVIVNVGDDTERYGVHVAADCDTVLYTLAGRAGPHGWGIANDTFAVMDALDSLGVDTSFRLGDADLAVCIARTSMLSDGRPLSEATIDLAKHLRVDDVRLIPATDDPLRTWVDTDDAGWIDFQHYFVDRRHTDEVRALAYHGAPTARPAPGVIDAIDGADILVIAPSNPPLSIWPILAIDDIRASVARHPRTIAVSPLFGGKPLKGPADAVMSSLGLPAGTEGILEAYRDLIDALVIDQGDAADGSLTDTYPVDILATDTRLDGESGGRTCVQAVLTWGRA